MSLDDILSSIDSESAQLKQAHALLAGIGTGTRDGKSADSPSVKPKRTMSAAARKKIADAQRRRWAATKKPTKPAPAKVAKKAAAPSKKRTTSAEAKKRIATAQKKRWAKIKAAKKPVKAAPVKKVARKAPAKKAGAVKKAAPKKAPAAKAKKAAPEKAAPTATEVAQHL